MRKTKCVGFKTYIPGTKIALHVDGNVLEEYTDCYIVESSELHELYRVRKSDFVGQRIERRMTNVL